MASNLLQSRNWSRNFRFQIAWRAVLLVLTIFAFAFTVLLKEWPVIMIFLVIAIAIEIWNLIRYVEQTNDELQQFLSAIAHRDFTYAAPGRKLQGKSFAELQAVSELIMNSFRELRAEKESHYQYLQNVVEHVQVALICYEDTEEVSLMNQAARQLINRPYLKHLHQLNHNHGDLLEAMRNISHGQRILIRSGPNARAPHIAIQATEFKLKTKGFKLVSLQDIQVELEEKEIDTWQKLIRVLTHEIMNSVTPIVSLTKVTHSMLSEEEGSPRAAKMLSEEEIQDILDSILTIENRSKGLLHFVHAYRSLTRIPPPQLSEVKAADLINRITRLLSPEMARRHIQLEISVPERGLLLYIDPQLIEQVLINLLKNAMEAVENIESPCIHLIARQRKDGRPQIIVQDNGPGIHPELVDKIFIPFFTTKTKGSGIGLSLSRQIMRLHQGSIEMQTIEDKGTHFFINFARKQESIKREVSAV
ncbi:MAG: ATP-binding protein [Bacteroidota bacterium]